MPHKTNIKRTRPPEMSDKEWLMDVLKNGEYHVYKGTLAPGSMFRDSVVGVTYMYYDDEWYPVRINLDEDKADGFVETPWGEQKVFEAKLTDI